MTEKDYMVETARWNNAQDDYEDEQCFRDLKGWEAMMLISKYMIEHPEARDGVVASDPDDGMFVTLREIKENGDEYWMSAYCKDK